VASHDKRDRELKSDDIGPVRVATIVVSIIDGLDYGNCMKRRLKTCLVLQKKNPTTSHSLSQEVSLY
jgi:hypothetical protein